MSQTIQKIIIAYAFFIFGMMGGFGFLEGYDYMLNSLFDHSGYLPWFYSALAALFFMGLMQIYQKKRE